MAATFKLPPRYEIRKLELEHLDWIKAILTHSNIFCSPIWKVLYPDDKAKRTYAMFNMLDYHVLHGIHSGHSYGAFDTEYKFKRPESTATGVKLYWQHDNLNATGAALSKPTLRRSTSRKATSSPASKWNWASNWPRRWTCDLRSSPPMTPTCCQAWKPASTTWPSTISL